MQYISGNTEIRRMPSAEFEITYMDILCAAFKQPMYKVDENLNVIEEK